MNFGTVPLFTVMKWSWIPIFHWKFFELSLMGNFGLEITKFEMFFIDPNVFCDILCYPKHVLHWGKISRHPELIQY